MSKQEVLFPISSQLCSISIQQMFRGNLAELLALTVQCVGRQGKDVDEQVATEGLPIGNGIEFLPAKIPSGMKQTKQKRFGAALLTRQLFRDGEASLQFAVQ